MSNELNVSLTTVGENQSGHLTKEDFYRIITNPNSPFRLVLETGGARFQLVGVSDVCDAYNVKRIQD